MDTQDATTKAAKYRRAIYNMHLVERRNVHDVVALLAREPGMMFSMVPEDQDDLWDLYNIIQRDDVCAAVTTRKVHTGPVSEDGCKGGETRRETVRLTIKVQHLDFDPKVNELRITGPIVKETGIASMGQRHSLTIREKVPLTIGRPTCWDSMTLSRLYQALTGVKEDAVPVIIVQTGLAWIVSIRQSRTIPLAKIEMAGQSRSKSTSKTSKAETEFYNEILDAFREKLLSSEVAPPKDLLMVSAGFWAEALRDHIRRVATTPSDKPLLELANKAVIAHSNTSLEHGILAVLQSPTIKEKLKTKSFASDQEAIDRLTVLLLKDDGRATYGKKNIEHAIEAVAITKGRGELFILDSLLRSLELETRKYWLKLTEQVKEAGGKVTVIGSENLAGEQLKEFGGVAAILSFPIEELDDEDMEEEDLEGLIV